MKYSFKTECSKTQLCEIRKFVANHLEDTNLVSKEKYQIILAIDEACANAIIHGNNCDTSRELQVELELTKEKLGIEIYDVGNYSPKEKDFNWETNDIIKESIRHKKKGGLGLKLMYHIMDKVSYYRRDDDKVNVCSLTKKLR